MGLFSFNPEDNLGSAWLLESFQRRFSSPSYHHFQFHGCPPYLVKREPGTWSRDEYLAFVYTQIQRMMDGRPVLRELNQDHRHLVKFPAIQEHLLQSVPQDVLDIYWRLNKQAYFMKQIAINNYLQVEPHRFLSHPSTELAMFFRSDSPRPKTNNDASRRSRVKKKISTELMLESYECDKAESVLLHEEEHQLHLIIAVLEDMLFEETGNARLISYYRDLSCLS